MYVQYLFVEFDTLWSIPMNLTVEIKVETHHPNKYSPAEILSM